MPSRHRTPPPDPSNPSASASPAAPPPRVAELRDWRGRRYSVGPPTRELTGQSRTLILVRALAAAASVGLLQFGYGAAAPVLVAAHDWSPAAVLAPFLAWTLAQGACAPALHVLRARGASAPGPAILMGALFCATALAVLGRAEGLLAVVLGYGVLGGIGAGLVYQSCVALVSGWFPDRRTVRSGAVGGAFALGAVPLLPAVATGLSPDSLGPACTALAAAVLLLGLAGGAGQTTAPPRWWPPGSDPRDLALRASADPPAAGDFSPTQAWATGRSLPILHAVVALAGAVGLFTIAVLPMAMLGAGRSPASVAAVVTAFAAASGLGRLAAGSAAERIGRRPVLATVLAAGALAHVGLASSLAYGHTALLTALALLTGLSAGACYPLTSSIAEDHFGSRDAPGIQSLVYSSKAIGGLLGVGGAALVLTLWPVGVQPAGLAAAGLVGAVAAVLAVGLRRPLPVRTVPVRGGVWTATRRHAPM